MSGGFAVWLEARKAKVIPVGDCFRFATMTANKMFCNDQFPDEEIAVVHGTVHPKWHPRPYLHAWIEAGGRCFDWQMNSTVGSLPKEEFYTEYRPDKMKRYTRQQAVQNMIKTGHHGPW